MNFLYYAVVHHDYALLEELLRRGVDPLAKGERYIKHSAAMQAVNLQDEKSLSLIMDSVPVNAWPQNEISALREMAHRTRNENLVHLVEKNNNR